jgi:hypothetical protein
LPDNYRDVQQELIAQIHRTSVWLVVVTVDGNISKPEKEEFIDRDGNQIILIPEEDIEIFKALIKGLAQDGSKFTRLRISEARCVVAGTNKLSASQKINIFVYLSKYRIYNCIIVSLEHYVIEGEYNRLINVVDTRMKLDVYTWFLYQRSDHCTEANYITLLNSWVISAQRNFTKNTDLFPENISNSFKGCPMEAIVTDGMWYFTTNYIYTDSNKSVG